MLNLMKKSYSKSFNKCFEVEFWMKRDESFVTLNIYISSLPRYAYLEVLQKLGWNRVASLTQDGHRYSEYISHLQDLLQTTGITFVMNRKFQSSSSDMTLVSWIIPFHF